MPNIEEQILTEFLLEVKAKMANITLSENEAINEITSYVLSNTGKFIRSKIIFLYGSEIGVKKTKLIRLDILFSFRLPPFITLLFHAYNQPEQDTHQYHETA